MTISLFRHYVDVHTVLKHQKVLQNWNAVRALESKLVKWHVCRIRRLPSAPIDIYKQFFEVNAPVA
jgi:hypothetical protein